MNPRKIQNHPLDTEKTLPYFVGHIAGGKTLSNKVCEKIDFTKGTFFTLLPENALLDRLFNFEWSIIPPKPNSEKIYMINGKPFHGIPLVTINQECSEFIAEFLAKSPQNWAVMEDYMLDPQSSNAHERNVKMSPYHSDVYYFLNKKNSLDEVLYTLKKAKQLWYFLAILTQLPDAVPDTLTEPMLDQICENAKFVIAGAYDGDGYIFWQRHH